MANFQDLTDSVFGSWKVIKYAGNNRWLCECQCENKTQKVVHGYSLRNGKSTSCGCKRKLVNSASRLEDIKGIQFGDWEVLEYVGNSYWKCRCSCGNIRNVKAQSLKSGKSTSCGHNTTGFKDLSNQVINNWEVLEYAGNGKWKCKCRLCGEVKLIETYNLTHGLSGSCGNHRLSNKLIDLTGQKFGELRVDKYIGGNKWLCTCSCGNKTIKFSHNLRRSDTISCGCKNKTYNKDELIKAIEEFSIENGELPFREDLVYILGVSQTTVNRYIDKFELNDYINKSFRSRQEREMARLFPPDSVNNRKILSSGEIDLYYKEKNLGIEFNGSYWHSEIHKDKKYHQLKSLDAIKNGLELFHIFEYEWDDDIVKNKLIRILSNKLGYNIENKRIYARNLDIREINSEESKAFLDEYHLQGSANASIRVGAFANNELVGVMIFGKPMFNDDYQYEVIRLCWKHNVTVTGGTERLFNYFVNKYKPYSVISYTDLSKFNGMVYTRLGFKCIGVTEPNYVWWDKRENIKLTRYETMKHKLVAKGLGTNDQTEDAIMYKLGYTKIYDCGNLVYIFNCNF